MTRWIFPPLSFLCMKITPNLCELQMECHKYSRVCSHSWKGFVHLICEPCRLDVFATVCQSTLEYVQVFFCIQIIPVVKLTENMLVKAQNISTVPSKHNLNSGNLLHKNNQIAVTKLKRCWSSCSGHLLEYMQDIQDICLIMECWTFLQLINKLPAIQITMSIFR